MRRKYIRFEQMDVFRPMPVPDALVERIRKDSECAKQLAAQVLNTEGQPVK